MHSVSVDPEIRVRLEQARQIRARVVNDGLSALFGRKPQPDRRR